MTTDIFTPTRLRVPSGTIYNNSSVPENTGTNIICIPKTSYQTQLTRYSGSRQVPDTLVDNPVDVDDLVECITDLADQIVDILQSDFISHLKSQLTEWCDVHGFDTIEDPATQTCIARQAALAFLLRTTLYEWHHRRGSLPALPSKPRTGLVLADVWIEELQTDWCVLDDLVHRVDHAALESVMAARSRLLKSTQPAEDIGRLYETLLSEGSRQTLGQFRTPPKVAEFMQAWGVQEGDTVLDPGMGAGVLSAPYHPHWDLSTDHDQVIGIDRSALSLLMGETALTLYGQSNTVQATDFLALSRQKSSQIDAIIGNPPYTSASDLPTEYKTTIRDRLEDTGVEIPGKAPLYVYFLFHAAMLLDDGDRCALLIPTAWMNTKYGTDVKQFLLNHYRLTAVIGTADEQFITGAAVDTVILLLERATDQERRETNIVSFGKVTESLDQIEQQIGFDHAVSLLTSDKSFQSSALKILSHQQNELLPSDDWGQYIRASGTDTEEIHAQLKLELQDLANVHTGLTSGNNEVFYLTDPEVAQAGIESKYVEPLIKSPKDCETYRLTESALDRWVLAVTEERAGLQGTGVEQYLETQESKGANERPALANKSTEWYVQEMCTGSILQPYTVGQRHFSCLNATTACVDKRLVCIDPHDDKQTDLLFAFLNSTVGVLLKELHGMIRSSGGLGTTVTTMQKFPVLDPNQLSPEQRSMLGAAAEQLELEPIRSIYTELGAKTPENVDIDAISDARRAVDTVIMTDVLGLSRQAQIQLYQDVLKLVTARVKRS